MDWHIIFEFQFSKLPPNTCNTKWNESVKQIVAPTVTDQEPNKTFSIEVISVICRDKKDV